MFCTVIWTFRFFLLWPLFSLKDVNLFVLLLFQWPMDFIFLLFSYTTPCVHVYACVYVYAASILFMQPVSVSMQTAYVCIQCMHVMCVFSQHVYACMQPCVCMQIVYKAGRQCVCLCVCCQCVCMCVCRQCVWLNRRVCTQIICLCFYVSRQCVCLHV